MTPAPRTAALAAALALALTGCGASRASGGGSTPTPTASASTGALSRPAEYSRCMRAHGEPRFPNPVDGHIILTPDSGINPASPAYQAASKSCAGFAPSGPGPGASGGDHRAGPVTAATWKGFGRWLAARAAKGEFSGAAIVAHGHRTFLDAGYGQADRATGSPDTPRTTFCIASIGKLLTAVAVAQLVQAGKLSFGDPVGRLLRGFTPATGRVTVGELLDMTAGLGNVARSGRLGRVRRERPRFTPGSKFFYSNDGYLVLGAVIARVSHQSYADYVERHILRPAGMTHTRLASYTPATVPGMAHGYAVAGSGLRDISGRLQIASPAGGAASTTGDLLRFGRAILDHRLLDRAMTMVVLTPRVNSPQPGGPPVDKYTYGFGYQASNGIAFVGHNGGTPGYEGQIDIYPASGYVVVILTNQDETMIPAIQRSEAILTGA